MTGPRVGAADVDPLEAFKALRAQQEPDPLAQFKALRAQTPAGGHDYHAEYASGALEKRMQGANARDVANAAEPTEVVGPVAAAGRALAATAANMGEGIPGFEAGQAGVRSVVRGEPYTEALGDLRRETGQLPSKLRGVERVAGALPLAKFLPKNPMLGGALLGGADQALAADPESLTRRGVGTVVGAAGGALLGKTGELAATGVRSALTPSPAGNIIARQADRALSAAQTYGAAMREGVNNTVTPAIQKFLAEPDIAAIVQRLQATRPFQGVAAHAPEMLDEIYKTLSDHAKALGKGLATVDPRNANSARIAQADTRMAQGDLLDAVSGGASMPGPMPSYRKAVENFASQSNEVAGVQKGYDALRTRLRKALPSASNLTRTTPEALNEWAAAASDAARDAAGEGILGAAKDATGLGLRTGFKAMSKAPSVMRDAQVPAQAIFDRLMQLGLLSGNAARPR